MKFLIPTLLFSSLALSTAVDFDATAVVRRSAKDITSAIATISSDVAILKKSVRAFTGDINDAITILNESNQVSDDIQAATQAANDSKKLNNSGSGKVASAILNLTPDVTSLLKLLVKKKPEFDKVLDGGGSQIVLQTLQQQKEYTDEFGAAVAAKLTKAYAAQAPAIQKKIDNAFNKAIVAYGGKPS